MKKRLIFILLVFSIIFIIGCAVEELPKVEDVFDNPIIEVEEEVVEEEIRSKPPTEETIDLSLEQVPVLKNLGIRIEPWDKKTNLAGDLIFSKDVLFEDENILSEKILAEFGDTTYDKRDPRPSVEYWFYPVKGTKVEANTEGVISIFFIEHTEDWGVSIHPEDSEYIISFEHLINLEVKEGDKVKTGDILGEVSLRKQFGKDIGFVELAVWQGGRNIFKYCPFDFLDDSLKPIYEEKINRLASDWEQFIGKDVYKEEDWVSPGCLVNKIQER